MKQDLQVIGALFGRWTGIAVLAALPVVLFHLDTLWLGNQVGEWSLVEVVAELFLASAILGFVRLARLSPEDRGFAVLAAAFLGCMLVRELDALLDLVFDGLWQVLVTVIAVSALTWAWRNRADAIASTRRFVLTRQASTLAVGMAVVLGFPRLFGIGDIWGQFIHLDAPRAVTTASQSGPAARRRHGGGAAVLAPVRHGRHLGPVHRPGRRPRGQERDRGMHRAAGLQPGAGRQRRLPPAPPPRPAPCPGRAGRARGAGVRTPRRPRLTHAPRARMACRGAAAAAPPAGHEEAEMGLLIDGRWVDQWYDTDSTGGKFVRGRSQFRNWVTADGSEGPTGGRS